MDNDERKTMIKIGKAVTQHGAAIKEILDILKAKPPAAIEAKPIETPFEVPRPAILSTVDHSNFPMRFKLEVGFAQGTMWSEEQRKQHSLDLLTQLEEVLVKFGVVTLFGNYDKYGLSKPVSTQG